MKSPACSPNSPRQSNSHKWNCIDQMQATCGMIPFPALIYPLQNLVSPASSAASSHPSCLSSSSVSTRLSASVMSHQEIPLFWFWCPSVMSDVLPPGSHSSADLSTAPPLLCQTHLKTSTETDKWIPASPKKPKKLTSLCVGVCLCVTKEKMNDSSSLYIFLRRPLPITLFGISHDVVSSRWVSQSCGLDSSWAFSDNENEND